jgi:hypothetical protein
MITAVDWTSASTILSGFAVFFVVALIPGALWFHRKVIRPLSFVLGLKAEESPTGEAIPPIPTQLAGMRKLQIDFKTGQDAQNGEIAIIKAELFPNHGSSLRDSVNRNEADTAKVKLAVIDLKQTVDTHMTDEREARDTTAALVLKTAADLAALTSKTATDLKNHGHEDA